MKMNQILIGIQTWNMGHHINSSSDAGDPLCFYNIFYIVKKLIYMYYYITMFVNYELK